MRAGYPEGRLCSVVSQAAGDDPAGSGGPFDGLLAFEVPLPWKREFSGSTGLPEGVAAAVESLREADAVHKAVGLVPDPEYSVEGRSRVLFLRRPDGGPFAAYERREYLVPVEDLAALLRALAGDPEPALLEDYRQDCAGVRDVLVCTHGSRDVCCGKFGYAVYNFLRTRHSAPGGPRVWRSSHLGGHRFAPTLLELPGGRYWGHLEIGAAADLITRAKHPSDLARHYRGWAGLKSPFEQVAERDILSREGWGWTGYLKAGEVLGTGADEGWAEVRVTYRSPDGRDTGAYEALVEADGTVMTLASSGNDPLEEVVRYRVARLEKVAKGPRSRACDRR